MMGWQWHQLDHMQIICTLLETDNYASTSSLITYQTLKLLKMSYETKTTRRPLKGPKNAVFVPGALDLQIRPSEGPNTSCVRIWRKSIQQFQRYFIHKQNTTA